MTQRNQHNRDVVPPGDPRQYAVRVFELVPKAQHRVDVASTPGDIRLQPSLGAARRRRDDLLATHDRVEVVVYDQFRGKWSVVSDDDDLALVEGDAGAVGLLPSHTADGGHAGRSDPGALPD